MEKRVEVDLLEKTELWIENIELSGADLNRIAAVVADVLRIDPGKVLVVDVRETHVVLDILQSRLQAEQLYGKETELLRNLSAVPGVTVTERTEIHSDGILGMIGLDEEQAKEVIERSSSMAADIASHIARRVYVYPTGFEVKRGMIKDTNTPFIKEFMEARGFKVTCGEVLDDDEEIIAGRIQAAMREGFGLVVTTGGVGAESKDRTVEAVLKVDPGARTPYIVHFTKGTGRHEKDGVRIAVGRVGMNTIVALPGPNDEVRIGLTVLVEGLEKRWGKEDLAEALVHAYRERLKERAPNSGSGHGHPHH
jgi:molybdenum cofactor synthesis domain-containing protein